MIQLMEIHVWTSTPRASSQHPPPVPLSSSFYSSSLLLQDWENNASRSVSLRVELEQVTQLIIQWRKLELR